MVYLPRVARVGLLDGLAIIRARREQEDVNDSNVQKIYDMVEMYGQAYLEAAYPLGEETQRNSEFGPMAKEVLEVRQRALDLDEQRTSDILKGKADLLPLEDVDAAYDEYDEVSKRYQEKTDTIFERYMRARRAIPPFRINRDTRTAQSERPCPITPLTTDSDGNTEGPRSALAKAIPAHLQHYFRSLLDPDCAYQRPEDGPLDLGMAMYGISGYGDSTFQDARTFQADPLDLSQASLTLFSYPYCGKMYYGTWTDGQKVVVKTAAAIRSKPLTSFFDEVRIYRHLEALQGDIIPRYITHGYTTFEGDAVAALVVEQVSDGPMLMAEEMDVRPELAMLSEENRKICMDALDRIHERGVALNDIHGAHLVFRPGGHGEAVKPVFVNFEYAEVHWEGVSSCDRAADHSSLKNVFNGA